MAYDSVPPKYLRVLNTLRERIEGGTYLPGSGLPSESQLAAEFSVSRNSVLKALGILRQDGWIESQQGVGHFVRGRMPAGRGSPSYARTGLDLDESTAVELLHVGPILAPPRIARLLHIPDGTPVYERRRRTVSDTGPVDLVTTYLPVDIAVGTDLTKASRVAGGMLAHIAAKKNLRADYADELLTARRSTDEEAELLGLEAGDPVLSVVITAHQANGDPIATSVVLLPGDRHEIEDSYPLS
jgi:GntR family transcriptional regulator